MERTYALCNNITFVFIINNGKLKLSLFHQKMMYQSSPHSISIEMLPFVTNICYEKLRLKIQFIF